MAEQKTQSETASSPTEDSPQQPLLGRIRAWATVSPLRSGLVAAGLLGLMAGTIAVWLVLADLAAEEEGPTMADALEALDQSDFELAGGLVDRIQEQHEILTADYGGPLFVLGAIRAKQAESQWAAERRRQDYLIASKYLEEAHALGVPQEREYEALFLLGKSFIGSDQLEKGVAVLLEALEKNPQYESEIHELLAQAYFFADQPDYQATTQHLDRVLADANLTDQQRTQALLRKVRALSRLSKHEDALQALEKLPTTANPSKRALVSGQVLLRMAGVATDPARRGQHLEQAEQALIDAERLDKLSTDVSGDAQYLRGQISELRSRSDDALSRYQGIRKRFGMSSAGIAASIAEAEIHRTAGDAQESLDAYRRALDAIRESTAYKSELLSLAEVRSIVLAAHAGFVAENKYADALTLIKQMGFMYGDESRLELTAETQEKWGEWLLERAGEKNWPTPEIQAKGRRRLREAGVTYQRLADERFATSHYPDDLWRAAQAYYRGQSYTSVAGVMRSYLKNEPVRYNAQALLLLGKSLLSQGEAEAAIDAFEECVEFHPNDAATYGARLAAAKAHRDVGQTQRAEELLRQNLLGGDISPRSPEWRDSKFELGSLLHAIGRYDEAIDHLEEAINRYQREPIARQLRTARYLVAEAYRNAAEEPLERFRSAKAVNERETAERLFRELLDHSLEHYEQVRREISQAATIDEMDRAMLRNCYMLKGSVLYDLGRFKQAVEEYSNVSALYQNEPFVLETLVQISNCWRRLGEPDKARGNIDQALVALERLPENADFLATTTRSRREWESLLTEIRTW